MLIMGDPSGERSVERKCLRTPDFDNSIKDRCCSVRSHGGLMPPRLKKSICKTFQDLTFTDMEISYDQPGGQHRRKRGKKDEKRTRGEN